eukprot:747306-Hanusia_phi.AAC.2
MALGNRLQTTSAPPITQHLNTAAKTGSAAFTTCTKLTAPRPIDRTVTRCPKPCRRETWRADVSKRSTRAHIVEALHLLKGLHVGLRRLGDRADADGPLWKEPDPGDDELSSSNSGITRENVEDLLVGDVVSDIERIPCDEVYAQEQEVSLRLLLSGRSRTRRLQSDRAACQGSCLH